MKKKINKTIRIILAVIFTLISIELILRAAGFFYLKTLFFDKLNTDNSSTNILVLGESTTAGLWVPRNESYPMQLQQGLQKIYPDKDIRVIVPPHMGQNTGHIANRIEAYLKVYKPKMVLIMAGYNNEWSLAESHVGRFISGTDGIKMKVLSFLDNFRICRMARFLFLHLSQNSLLDRDFVLGGPEYSRYPPVKDVYSFALDHQKEFTMSWRYDIKLIIDAAKKQNATAVLMTYHINPSYLPAEEFERLAHEENISLIRNDLIFRPIIDNGLLGDYVFKTDNWHPNYRGYRLIAENIEQKIIEKKLLV